MTILKYGKYAGRDISEVPDDYLEWMKRDSEEKIAIVDKELKRRRDRIDNSWMKQIVEFGYQHFKSNSTTPQLKLEAAYQALIDAIEEVGKVQQ